MLPRWHEERVQDILQTMVGRWMDAGTANVKQCVSSPSHRVFFADQMTHISCSCRFELLDLSMTHNKAYQAGVIVDCLGMPESSGMVPASPLKMLPLLNLCFLLQAPAADVVLTHAHAASLHGTRYNQRWASRCSSFSGSGSTSLRRMSRQRTTLPSCAACGEPGTPPSVN